MPDTDPHTAELVDEDPDQRRAPRPGLEASPPAASSCSSRRPSQDLEHDERHARQAGGNTTAEARAALSTAYAAVLACWYPERNTPAGEALWHPSVSLLLQSMHHFDEWSAERGQGDRQGE